MTTETKIVNYTEEQTLEVVQQYKAGVPVEQIATQMGKTTRSIVAKLSREGVYVAKNKLKQPARVKKAELVDKLAMACGVAPEIFESLEKANHEVLEVLAEKLA